MDISSLNVRLVRSQISQVRYSLGRLSKLASLAEADFLSDPDNFAIAEHHLRRAIEAGLDVGRHLVAKLALGRAEEYADIARLLGEHHVIPAHVVAETVRLAKLRNRLVHFYWQVGPAEMYELLTTRLGHLESFCTEVLAFIEANRPRVAQAGSG